MNLGPYFHKINDTGVYNFEKTKSLFDRKINNTVKYKRVNVIFIFEICECYIKNPKLCE